MNRLAFADPSASAPRSYQELADRRVYVTDAASPLSAIAAHAFAAQDCRMVLQGGAAVSQLAGELQECANAVRVFSATPADVKEAGRLSDAGVRAFQGLDVAIVKLDLRVNALIKVMDERGKASADITDSTGLAFAFEEALTVSETIAEHMARSGGGTIAYLVDIDPMLPTTGLATLSQASLEAVLGEQVDAWEDAGVRFLAVLADDPSNDTVALEAAGALLMAASGRAEWLEGVVVRL